jgi:hypothetical protein
MPPPPTATAVGDEGSTFLPPGTLH